MLSRGRRLHLPRGVQSRHSAPVRSVSVMICCEASFTEDVGEGRRSVGGVSARAQCFLAGRRRSAVSGPDHHRAAEARPRGVQNRLGRHRAGWRRDRTMAHREGGWRPSELTRFVQLPRASHAHAECIGSSGSSQAVMSRYCAATSACMSASGQKPRCETSSAAAVAAEKRKSSDQDGAVPTENRR